MQTKWITPKETAKLIGVSEDLILHLIHSEKLPASNVSQGKVRPRWKISTDDIDAYMKRHQKKSPVKSKRRGRPVVVEVEYV